MRRPHASLRQTAESAPLLQTRVGPAHPQRREVEDFIAAVYRARYGAEIAVTMPELLAFRGADGRLRAAVGIRCARQGRLFVERYLDAPAQRAIADSLGERLGQRVRRAELVEVGHFASETPGDARAVIVRLTHTLHTAGVRWVLFAATRQLRNAFDRLHLATAPLAPADPARLGDEVAHWGSYYESQPQVVFGDVAAGHAFLQRTAADEAATRRPALGLALLPAVPAFSCLEASA
jgi:Thermostable hemolysin